MIHSRACWLDEYRTAGRRPSRHRARVARDLEREDRHAAQRLRPISTSLTRRGCAAASSAAPRRASGAARRSRPCRRRSCRSRAGRRRRSRRGARPRRAAARSGAPRLQARARCSFAAWPEVATISTVRARAALGDVEALAGELLQGRRVGLDAIGARARCRRRTRTPARRQRHRAEAAAARSAVRTPLLLEIPADADSYRRGSITDGGAPRLGGVIEQLVEQIEARYADAQRELSAPEVIGDRRRYADAGRRFNQLAPAAKLAEEWRLAALRRRGRAGAARRGRRGPRAARRAARRPRAASSASRRRSASRWSSATPATTRTSSSRSAAARAATRPSLWAGDLYRMLTRYADRRGFTTETLDAGEGSFTVEVRGDGAYSVFKFEGGTHRVQRVPETESQGRIHTSTATVAVLPEAEEVDVQIDPGDLEIDVRRIRGLPAEGAAARARRGRLTRRARGGRERDRDRGPGPQGGKAGQLRGGLRRAERVHLQPRWLGGRATARDRRRAAPGAARALPSVLHGRVALGCRPALPFGGPDGGGRCADGGHAGRHRRHRAGDVLGARGGRPAEGGGADERALGAQERALPRYPHRARGRAARAGTGGRRPGRRADGRGRRGLPAGLHRGSRGHAVGDAEAGAEELTFDLSEQGARA